MLGYGLANSYTQKFSVENLIYSFFNRSLIGNLTYLLGIKILINQKYYDGTTTPQNFLTKDIENFQEYEDLIDNFFNLFLEEEYFLTKGLEVSSTNLEIDYQKELYKYILSANIINNKDYSFDAKLKEVVIGDGKENLKNLFYNLLLFFMNNSKPLVGQNSKINDLLKDEKGRKIFFIFENNLNEKEEQKQEKYYVRKDLRKNMPIILLKYRKDIKKYVSSGFFNFYKNNNYLTIRNDYLEILKYQISGLSEGKII